MNASNSRRQLDAIGRRRKALDRKQAKLHLDTKKAIANSRKAGVPTKEAAKRVGLTRTTIYQVYVARRSDAGEPVAATG